MQSVFCTQATVRNFPSLLQNRRVFLNIYPRAGFPPGNHLAPFGKGIGLVLVIQYVRPRQLDPAVLDPLLHLQLGFRF